MGRKQNGGFTLIELSIVLVIIGLIVGGVLVGQDLIEAAQVRAQISQIEKYNTAVNTFRLKFGYLPGDIPDPPASGFGFAQRGTGRGEGDGNGVLESQGDSSVWTIWQANGETCGLWMDLAQASLIAGAFGSNGACTLSRSFGGGWKNNPSAYLPAAKIAQDYVFVWSGGGPSPLSSNGINCFGVSAARILNGWLQGTPGLTVAQAYAIDSKTDDGYPQTGRVTAQYVSSYTTGGGSMNGWPAPIYADQDLGPGDGTATPPTATTCYDDGGVTGAVRQYSMGQNGGANINCGLSFRFQ